MVGRGPADAVGGLGWWGERPATPQLRGGAGPGFGGCGGVGTKAGAETKPHGPQPPPGTKATPCPVEPDAPPPPPRVGARLSPQVLCGNPETRSRVLGPDPPAILKIESSL